MLKLMIVDDEAVIRSGIASVVDWMSLGIEVVGEAANGRDALNRALLLRPDIVMTDIKMPIIDGLEFARELLKKRPDTRVVLLTGYSDFQYMQQAIQMGAVDYLLKPVRVDDLEKLMRRLCTDIRAQREEKMRQIATQQVLARNLPVMRGACLRDFLAGRTTADAFASGARELGIPLAGPRFVAVELDIDDWEQHASEQGGAPLTRYSVMNIAEEQLGELGDAAFGYLQAESSLLGVVRLEQGEQEDVTEACRQIQFYVQRFFHFTLTAAVGPCVGTLEELRGSCIRARDALEHKVYMGKNQVILAENVPAGAGGGTVLLAREDEEALKEAVAMNKNLAAQKKLDEIFRTYFENGAYTRKAVRQFGNVLLRLVLRALQDAQIDPQEAFGQNVHIVDEIECYETLDEIRMFVKNVYSRAVRVLEGRQGSNYRHTVRDSIEYVKAHYAESIQVSDVAAAVYVTPNYFSKIFKQETGENFTEWLNKFRIEKAKALILQQQGEKVYEIAAKVGFHDYKYFAFIFKKYTGYTPGTFKELNH